MSDTTDNVAIARKALDYLHKSAVDRTLADYQPLFDLMADDAVWRLSCSEDTPVYGGEFDKKAFIKLFTVDDPEAAEAPEAVGEIQYFSNDEGRVVVLFTQRYVVRATGRNVCNEGVIVLDLRDGLIRRMLEIQDMSEFVLAMRASGAEQPAN